MKKDYFLITAIVFITLAYVIDLISGKIDFPVSSHFAFLSSPYLSKFPLTSLGIFIRSIGVFILAWLIMSLITGLYFQKSIASIVLIILSNLYSFQQLSTGMKITPLQWTISIGLSGSLLILPAIFYLFKGLTSSVSQKISPPPTQSQPDSSSDNPFGSSNS